MEAVDVTVDARHAAGTSRAAVGLPDYHGGVDHRPPRVVARDLSASRRSIPKDLRWSRYRWKA